MQNISFSEFLENNVSFTNLFVDYIEQKESITKFFNEANIQNYSTWKKIISDFKFNFEIRNDLVQILHEQNKNLHCSIQTLSNIDLLQNQNTFCIITGQQAGVLSGPLYTIFKTISAIKLAEKLTLEFPNFHFVPVFWVESEDHDIEEISTIGLINSKNEFIEQKFDFFKSDLNLKPNSPVKNLNVNEDFQVFIDSIFEQLQKTDFSEQIKILFKSFYLNDSKVVLSFCKMMSDLFRDFGLIVVNPSDEKIKSLLKNIFLSEINSNSATSKSVIKSSYELEKKYFAQVQPRSINLFFEFQGGRFAIQEDEKGYFLQGTRKRFSVDELSDLVNNNPELFSPNVVLRPICQDFLFPTLSYVGGPSEIAYFAQLKEVYDNFNLTMPIIYPRVSATLIEDKILKVMEKYNFEIISLLNNFSSLRNKILEETSEIKIDDIFKNLVDQNRELFNEAKFAAMEIDSTLENTIDNFILKYESNLNVLKEKIRTSQIKKQEIVVNQLLKVKNNLFPQSELQERKLNLIYFLNKYGIDFVKWLYGEIDIINQSNQSIKI